MTAQPTTIAQHVAVSQRVTFEDLDFAHARRIGLTERERQSLGFFADVESQTVYYFLEVARLQVARDPELLTFLTLWNYEEYFHAHAITSLVTACGGEVESATARATRIRAGARWKARLEDLAQRVMARLVPERFIALWMVWGALQECLTTQGYEELIRTTHNPVLAELLRRIAKQERRHFAYYFGQARARLVDSPRNQRFCRAIVDRFFAPVGSGVKDPAQIAALIAGLFPGARLFEVMRYVERRLGQLPGLTGLDACTRWARGIQPLLPAEQRVDPEPEAAAIAA